MKKLVCLGLCLILSGCTSAPVAKNDAVRKVNVNVIEVSASTIDEIEEMASKDVEDTKAKLESERDALALAHGILIINANAMLLAPG